MTTRRTHVLAALAIGTAAAGCSANDTGQASATPAPTEVHGISLLPELDPVTGAVVLPADRFMYTPIEHELLAVAEAHTLSACAAERGVTFVPPEARSNPVHLSEHYFGPWTADQASRFAFLPPMSDADLVANGYVDAGIEMQGDSPVGVDTPNAALTDSDWTVIDDCAKDDSGAQFEEALSAQGPWTQALFDVESKVVKDRDAHEATRDLHACYDEAGLDVAKDAVWVPEGAQQDVIDEAQIVLAHEVVDCKERVDFTARMAQVHARLQAPVIAEYAEELQAQRARIDEALVAARTLVGAGAVAAGR